MNHPRCPDCPISGRCIQESTGHTPYCDWARRGGAHRRRVEELSAAGPPETAEYPSLATQATSLARSLWDWAISGFKLAGDEEQARRRSICAVCPNWVAADRRCRLCGCHTTAKIGMKTEHCPDNPPRW